MTIAQTVWGAAGGPTVNASLNSSKQQDKQTTHNNSTLTANNLNIATIGDANIIGGNLHGANAVNMDIGGDLTLESVQDRFSGSNKGAGISGGMSLGGVFTNENGAKANSKEVKTTAIGQGGDVSSVNGGVNASSGRYRKTETVLSSITGGTVDVSVDGNTQLTGALLAAVDAEGNDTGELNLDTGSLNTTDLTNRSYSSNQSFGVNASVGVSDAANPADPALNSSNYSYQSESSQSLDKILATIGEGSVSVSGEDTSPDGVNRDVASVNKEIYDVDRQQGDIDLTVDHRLLSEDSLRDHMGNKQDYFTATKNFTQNPANAEHVKTLSDDNATPEQKQEAYTALVNEIADYMGVDPTEAKVLMSNDPRFAEVAGAHSRDTDTVYVNDAAHDNASKAVNTVGHETQHYLDNQQNPDAEQTKQYKANREEYAGIMGDATADYLGFNFAQNDSQLADSNNHNLGSSFEEIESNIKTINENHQQYSEEDPNSLEDKQLNVSRELDLGLIPEKYQHAASVIVRESPDDFTAEEKAKYGEPIEIEGQGFGYAFEALSIEIKDDQSGDAFYLVPVVNGYMLVDGELMPEPEMEDGETFTVRKLNEGDYTLHGEIPDNVESETALMNEYGDDMQNQESWKDYPSAVDTIMCALKDCTGDNAIYNSNTYYHDKQVEAGQTPSPVNDEVTLPGYPKIKKESKPR